MTEHLTRDVLKRASIGFALVEADTAVWTNPAFDKLAEQADKSPAHLARTALAAGGTLHLPSGAYTVRQHADRSPELIELIPTAAAEPARTRVADQDSLTGVLSRGPLDGRIDAWFQGRERRPFALAFLDLDGFKRINDSHGHLVGDACLREIGERLCHAVREGDVIGRFGGDEFVLLVSGVEDPDGFQPIADRLATAIQRPIETSAGPIELGFSHGEAFSRGDHADTTAMLAAADRAMYARKADKKAKPAAAD